MRQLLSSVNLAVFVPLFFLANNTSKTLSFFLQVGFLFQLISVKFTSCSIPQANLLQHFIRFSKSKIQVQKPQPSSILFHLYGMIIIFGGQMKKWLWCNHFFQGINATKALAHIQEKIGITRSSLTQNNGNLPLPLFGGKPNCSPE